MKAPPRWRALPEHSSSLPEARPADQTSFDGARAFPPGLAATRARQLAAQGLETPVQRWKAAPRWRALPERSNLLLEMWPAGQTSFDRVRDCLRAATEARQLASCLEQWRGPRCWAIRPPGAARLDQKGQPLARHSALKEAGAPRARLEQPTEQRHSATRVPRPGRTARGQPSS